MIDLEEHEHLYSIESSHPRALWVSLFIHIFKIVLHLSPALFLLNLFLGSVFFVVVTVTSQKTVSFVIMFLLVTLLN